MHADTSTSTDRKQPGSDRQPLHWSGQNAGPRPRRSLMEGWYTLAAPSEPPDATPQDRERVRAGRLSSIVLLIMLCFGLTQLPNALISRNHLFLIILLTAMSINVVAFVFNRQGKVIATGTIMIVVVEVAFILVVLTSSIPLSVRSLTTFYLIVLTELMAVSLLPPKSVFLAMLCNALFTWAAISFLPHAADFQLVTASIYYSALIGPLVLQIIVAIITYLWAEGARQAIERAERVAALEHALAERDRAASEQKQQLEQGIQQILQTHIQAANGNFEARAPLARENVLWQVAYGLNNLLARLQRATQAESELQRTKIETARLTEAVRVAKARRYPLQVPKSGTALDPLAHELIGTYIEQP